MKMRILTAAVFAVLISSSSIAADYLSAKQLKDDCVQQNQTCIAYMRGYIEGHTMGLADAANKFGLMQKSSADPITLEARFSSFCPDRLVSTEQISEVFVKYTSDHPESLHEAAFNVLAKALRQYFPCKKQTGVPSERR